MTSPRVITTEHPMAAPPRWASCDLERTVMLADRRTAPSGPGVPGALRPSWAPRTAGPAGLAAAAHDPALLVGHAQECLENNDAAGAARAAWRALGAAPTSEPAMRVYTSALDRQRRFPEALWMAWQTVRQHPYSHRAHDTYAKLLHDSGRDVEALAVIDQALRLDPRSADSLVLRGDIVGSLGRVAHSEAQYLEALKLDPYHGMATHNLAVKRLRWGSLTRAVRGLVASVGMNPALGPLALANIGAALIRVLRMATLFVVPMFFALAAVAIAYEDGWSPVIPRIAAAVLGAGLAIPVVWVLHTVPWSALTVVLRQQFVLAARLGFVCLAAVLGLAAAVIGMNPLIALGAIFLLPAFTLMRIVGAIVRQ